MTLATAIKRTINREIEWCRKYRGVSGKGPKFEQGFIAGLKQAKRFVGYADCLSRLRKEE
jgi:hypothetical protein